MQICFYQKYTVFTESIHVQVVTKKNGPFLKSHISATNQNFVTKFALIVLRPNHIWCTNFFGSNFILPKVITNLQKNPYFVVNKHNVMHENKFSYLKSSYLCSYCTRCINMPAPSQVYYKINSHKKAVA